MILSMDLEAATEIVTIMELVLVQIMMIKILIARVMVM